MSNLAIKLQKKIKNDLGIEVEPKIYRTYAGFWQKTQGVWSWFMRIKTPTLIDLGGPVPAKQVAKYKKLCMSDIDGELFEDKNITLINKTL